MNKISKNLSKRFCQTNYHKSFSVNDNFKMFFNEEGITFFDPNVYPNGCHI